jgi:hypothetical protein
MDSTDSILMDYPTTPMHLLGTRKSLEQKFNNPIEKLWRRRMNVGNSVILTPKELGSRDQYLFVIFNRVNDYNDPDPIKYKEAIRVIGVEARSRGVTVLATIKTPSKGRYYTWKQNAHIIGEILEEYGVKVKVYTEEY